MHSFRTLLAALVILTGGLNGVALAESPKLVPAPFAVPPEGTRMVFEDLESGDRITGIVGQPDGFIVNWTWQGQPGSSVTHFCSDCLLLGIGADGGPLAKLYPLERGKGVRFKRSRGDTVWEDEILVIGTDRVETPAGAFDTYVIRRRSTTADDTWRGEQRSWYAPELGWIVRFEGYDNTGRRQGFQLVDYD